MEIEVILRNTRLVGEYPLNTCALWCLVKNNNRGTNHGGKELSTLFSFVTHPLADEKKALVKGLFAVYHLLMGFPIKERCVFVPNMYFLLIFVQCAYSPCLKVQVVMVCHSYGHRFLQEWYDLDWMMK